MKFMRIFLWVLLLMMSGIQVRAQDWPELLHYRSANALIGLPDTNEDRVVFMGNSIIEEWAKMVPDFFAGKSFVNRGISGQTSPQMLVRFRQDVISLKPKVVLILAGTNDIAGNTGPADPEMIIDNIASMAELAASNGIRVILCSVLPAYEYPWARDVHPAGIIETLNRRIKKYAREKDFVYLDYYSSMVDARGGFEARYTRDGVHPNNAGYKMMAPLTIQAINQALIK